MAEAQSQFSIDPHQVANPASGFVSIRPVQFYDGPYCALFYFVGAGEPETGGAARRVWRAA
jgi:hypothetical protein